MNTICRYLIIALFLTGLPNVGVAQDETREDTGTWEYIFNKKDLDGWKQRGGEARYHVENGTIVGTSVKGTPNSFLCTRENYRDFILELEVKADWGLNSGIQIRSNEVDGRVRGYQVEIDPTERSFSGRIWDEARRRKWLDVLADTAAVRAAFIPEEWNKFRIEAVGDSIKTWINGVPVAQIADTMTSRGFIGLQVHKVGKEDPMQVRWRNIRIQVQ